MRFYFTILFILLIPLLAAGAEWSSLDVRIIETGASDEKGSTKYILADSKGQNFEVNYSDTPAEDKQKKVLSLKDTFYSWERISISRMEFFFSGEGIYSILHIKKVTYREKDLLPYLPAGLAFQDRKEGLYYRFRILVDNTSYMLEGIYTDEEALLKRIYDFIETEEGTVQKEPAPEVKAAVEEKKVQHRLSVCAYGNYLYPTGKLSTVFSGGYGGMAGITLHDIGISFTDKTLFHLDFTLAAGYWYYGVKDYSGEITSCSIDSAFIIPISLTARYRITFLQDFFIAPNVSVGFNYNSIDYYEPVSGGDDKAVKIREWAPSLLGGVQLGYSVIKERLTIIAGVQYTGMYERYMTTSSFVFHTGVEYSFMVFGD